MNLQVISNFQFVRLDNLVFFLKVSQYRRICFYISSTASLQGTVRLMKEADQIWTPHFASVHCTFSLSNAPALH